MTAKGPILDISTLEPERPFLKIDGEPYELAVGGDFGILERARLSRLMADIKAVQDEASTALSKRAFGALSEDHARRLEKVLEETTAMLVRAPTTVLAKLRTDQQLAVIAAFTPTLSGAATAPPKPRRSTSGRSSRRSPASTAPVPG